MLPIQYFLPLVLIGVGGTFVAGTFNRLQTETRIDRSKFEKTSTVNNIYKVSGAGIKRFLGGK
ncbi:hypothetical protein OVS_01480 [Mycoplasma ovis str. Michigan]|uniref:Uncharacterized protein n=1 Tax=Mycoplasma ovis str. Michigan TaxID=1415773 RepID=A0ABM5P1M1_9MOLU|nr:hypothetical protein OVS_01480 [Mycoplasma ovis str. Michigan]